MDPRQARTISQKYIRPDYGTTDMALLFLPSEMLYFEVIRDTALFDAMAKLKVFPVSPNTLAISLRSVAMAQDYYEMARGVEKTIEEVTKARKHFEHFETKFEDIGKGLKKAQEAFETANTHLGRYESSIVRLVGDTEKLALSLPRLRNRRATRHLRKVVGHLFSTRPDPRRDSARRRVRATEARPGRGPKPRA